MELQGLTGSPELNGQLGELVIFVASTGRWEVRLDRSGPKTLRPGNLKLAGLAGASRSDSLLEQPGRHVGCPSIATAATLGGDEATATLKEAGLREGAMVELLGLTAAAEFNGCRGRLMRFDTATERWEVSLVGLGPRMVRPANLAGVPTSDEQEQVARARKFEALDAELAQLCTHSDDGPASRFAAAAMDQLDEEPHSEELVDAGHRDATLSEARLAKERGNEAFRRGAFKEAVDHYTEAIRCDPADHIFFSNRSACQVSLGNYEQALQDASRCVELKPSWPKGYLRKGQAEILLESYGQALATYNVGLQVDPENVPLREGLEQAWQQCKQP